MRSRNKDKVTPVNSKRSNKEKIIKPAPLGSQQVTTVKSKKKLNSTNSNHSLDITKVSSSEGNFKSSPVKVKGTNTGKHKRVMTMSQANTTAVPGNKLNK